MQVLVAKPGVCTCVRVHVFVVCVKDDDVIFLLTRWGLEGSHDWHWFFSSPYLRLHWFRDRLVQEHRGEWCLPAKVRGGKVLYLSFASFILLICPFCCWELCHCSFSSFCSSSFLVVLVLFVVFVIVFVVVFVIVFVFVYSVRVEGTLPGFEIVISDTKLASLVKVGRAPQEPSICWH